MHIPQGKDHHRRQDDAVGIVIGHGAEDDARGQQDAVLPVIVAPPGPQQPVADHGHRQHGHGIRIDIGVEEDILGQEHGHDGESPLQICVLPQKPGRLPHEIGHQHAEEHVHHPGRHQQHLAVCGEQLQEPQQKALYDIGQHGLERVGSPEAVQQHLRVGPMGKTAVSADKAHHLEAVDFVRGISIGLHHGKAGDCREDQQVKDGIRHEVVSFVLVP